MLLCKSSESVERFQERLSSFFSLYQTSLSSPYRSDQIPHLQRTSPTSSKAQSILEFLNKCHRYFPSDGSTLSPDKTKSNWFFFLFFSFWGALQPNCWSFIDRFKSHFSFCWSSWSLHSSNIIEMISSMWQKPFHKRSESFYSFYDNNTSKVW